MMTMTMMMVLIFMMRLIWMIWMRRRRRRSGFMLLLMMIACGSGLRMRSWQNKLETSLIITLCTLFLKGSGMEGPDSLLFCGKRSKKKKILIALFLILFLGVGEPLETEVLLRWKNTIGRMFANLTRYLLMFG